MANLQNTTINDSGFIQIPSGTTSERPSSPEAGMIRYNTSLGITEWYTGSAWQKVILGPESGPVDFPQGLTVGSGSIGNGISEQNGTLRINTNGSAKFELDNAGRMRLFEQPAFAVSKGSGSVYNAGETVNFDHTWYNKGGHMNLSNGVFTAPVNGLYYFTWYDIYGNNTVRNNFYMRVNGSDFVRTRDDTRNNRWHTVSFGTVRELSAGDSVSLYVRSGRVYSNFIRWLRFSGWLIY